MRILAKTSLLTVGLITASVIGVPVLALGAPNSHANARAAAETTTVESTNEDSNTTDTTVAEHKATRQAKLADHKLKACQNREKAVNNIMGRVADRGQKQLDLFSSIAAKTEAFYTAKGKVLSNYDALVSDVNTAKDNAQTTVDAVKANSVTFKCDGTDPKGAAASFKTSLKSEIDALKKYKTAVKNLIVGVKSVQSTAASTNDSTGGDQ